MAAWSAHKDESWAEIPVRRVVETMHEDGPWVETRSALGQKVSLAPCPSCNHAMGDECTNCSEPFPTEVWTFFSDADLDQLVVDVMAEIGRRKMAA